eukprot:Skav228837  [mRNA]  locus=scaffold4680:33551:37431:- [translate_table: standard]
MPQHLVQGQTERWLPLQQPSHQVHHQGRQTRRKNHGDLQDPVDEHSVIRALKRRSTYHHLIEQNSHTPNVQGLVMTTSLDHLRSKIVHRAAKCGSKHICSSTPSKVCNLQDIIVGYQKVLRLQVAVNDLMLVEILQTPHQLHEEMFRRWFIKLPALLAPQKLIELSLGTVLQQQKDILLILKVLEEA